MLRRFVPTHPVAAIALGATALLSACAGGSASAQKVATLTETGTASTTATSTPADTQEALLAYAACMRGHGLPDWPDPTPSGTFKLPPRLRPVAGQGKRAATVFDVQDRACRNVLPAGWGLRVEG